MFEYLTVYIISKTLFGRSPPSDYINKFYVVESTAQIFFQPDRISTYICNGIKSKSRQGQIDRACFFGLDKKVCSPRVNNVKNIYFA